MLKEAVYAAGGRRIVIMDSITKVASEDEGCFVVAASHGGASSGEFALDVPLGLVVLNDAGIGKDQAGIAALGMLEAHGVAAATVSHNSARIGDSRDMWECGVISRVNIPARTLGLAEGQSLKDTLPDVLKG
jgi:hypothetical protein